MKPDDFLVVAEQLSKGAMEAHWRSSISRSYYALFNLILHELSSTVKWRNDASDHEIAIQVLNNTKAHDIAKVLDNLRETRNMDDYDMQATFSHRKTAEWHYRKSKSSIDIFRQLHRSELDVEIRTYLIKTGRDELLRN